MSSSRNWHQRVLPSFTSELATMKSSGISLVLDPDGLMLDELLGHALWERGFELIASDDPMEMRLRFERARAELESADAASRPIVLRYSAQSETEVPYDIVQHCARSGRLYAQWRLSEWLTSLDALVAAACGADLLDEVLAVDQAAVGRVSPDETADVILEDVYALRLPPGNGAGRLMEELVGWLLADGRRLPAGPILEKAARRCAQAVPEAEWELMLSDASVFWAWVDAAWGAVVAGVPHVLSNAFKYERLWLVLDDAFDRGLLRRRAPDSVETVLPLWAAGLVKPNVDSVDLNTLLSAAEMALPTAEASVDDWLAFVPQYAAAVSRIIGARDPGSEMLARLDGLRTTADTGFQEWMLTKYRHLHSLSPTKPRLVYRVLSALGRVRATSASRTALIVMDGMSWLDWVVLRDDVLDRFGTRVSEDSVFALVPTSTDVSRLALLSGSKRRGEGTEEKNFRDYWAEQGLGASACVLITQGVRSIDALVADVAASARDSRVQAMAVVVSDLDEMMHGSKYRSAQVAQLRDWTERGSLVRMLEVVSDAGFQIVLTADHGSTACVGVGRPNVGSMPTDKGSRALRGFTDEASARRVEREGFECIYWGPEESGLGGETWDVLAVPRQSFQSRGSQAITHGGITPEEVIVPLVTIRSE